MLTTFGEWARGMEDDIERVREELRRYRLLLEQTTDDRAADVLRTLIVNAQRRLNGLAHGTKPDGTESARAGERHHG